MIDDMQPIFHCLPGRTIRVWAVADVHIGSQQCDLDGFRRFIRRIEDSEDDYLVLVGDLIDNGTKRSKTSVYEQVYTPSQQMDEAVRILKPVADAGRILAAVCGNHERRSTIDVDIDPMNEICVRLGISHLYRQNMAFVRVKMEHNGTHDLFNLLITHGRSEAAKKRFEYAIEGVDAIITGHTHNGAVWKPARIVFTAGGTVRVKSLVSITACSWVSYGGYAAAALYQPKATSDPQHLILEFAGTNTRRGRVTAVW